MHHCGTFEIQNISKTLLQFYYLFIQHVHKVMPTKLATFVLNLKAFICYQRTY